MLYNFYFFLFRFEEVLVFQSADVSAGIQFRWAPR